MPLGYVSFTVPYQIEFFSGIGGRSMPYYDKELERVWADVFSGALIWGWEYVLSHHYNQNNQVQAFPNGKTVIQRVARDGLIEWADGEQEPISSDFFEELRLYGQETIDIHGHYLGSRNVAIRRAQFGLLIESAVMDAAFFPGPNHADYRDLSTQEYADFRDSLTLEAYNFWELSIDIQDIPTHQHTWWARTFDPARAGETTWESGVYNYVSNSPAKLTCYKPLNHRKVNAVPIKQEKVLLGSEECELCVKRLSYGILNNYTSFQIKSKLLNVTIQIGKDNVDWSTCKSLLRISDIGIYFKDVKEPVFMDKALILPNTGHYQVSFKSIKEFISFVKPRVLLFYSR